MATQTGSISNDSLTGTSDNDTIAGLQGDDTINGGGGNDVLLGNQGNDSITDGDGKNTVYGGMDNDQITVGNGSNLLFGNEGSDTIMAGDGGNTIVGGQDSTDGADLITSGSGNDLILGNGGDDTVAAGAGADTVVGGFGADIILGNQGNDFLLGNQGDDTLYGGQGADTLVGGMGNDVLYGNEGDDLIIGSEGDDTASFSGTRASYAVAQDAAGNFILSGGDGTDTVSTVEHFQFSDGTVDAANLIQGTGGGGGGTTPVPPAPSADLRITATASNSTPNVGDRVTFTDTLTNNGPDQATGVTAADALPAGLTFVSAMPSVGTYNPATGAWTVGTVAPNSTATLAITATVASATARTNTATITHSDQADPVAGNNSASTTETPQQADLAITATVSNASPVVGDQIILTDTLTNNGPGGVTGVAALDQLPAGLTFVSAAPSQGTYDVATGSWVVGTLSSGAQASLIITATASSYGPSTNTATISHSDQVDTNAANDSASASENAIYSPQANPDINSYTEGSNRPVTGNVLTNDTRSPGEFLIVGNPGTYDGTFGVTTINQDGTYIDTPKDPNIDPAVSMALNTPGPHRDQILYTAIDQVGKTTQSSLTITYVLSPPVITTTGGSQDYNAGQGATPIDTNVRVADNDGTRLTGASVQITRNFIQGEDVLSLSNFTESAVSDAQGYHQLTTAGYTTLSVNIDNNAGTVSIRGSDTHAHYQDVLDAVNYNNTSGAPSNLSRQVTFTGIDEDGLRSIGATDNINVIP
jgi:uncharacterized repeat protein (TIGR01451 family)